MERERDNQEYERELREEGRERERLHHAKEQGQREELREMERFYREFLLLLSAVAS